MKYISKSNHPFELINLIFDLISFLFEDIEELMEYFDSFGTGTHIFLFDLKTNDNSEIYYLRTSKEKNLVY